MSTNTWKVQLHVYDLSGGLVKQFSPMFVGKQFDGLWHTGLLVYGQEYYYGGGICHGIPGKTPYGTPLKLEELGTTEIPQDIFEDYLQDLSKEFTMEKYDLFDKNCNSFTDEAAKFLVGKGLPEYIIGLPKEILNTPFGQMIKPIVDSMTRSMQQQSGQTQMFPSLFEGQSNPQGLFQQQNQQQKAQLQKTSSQIKELKNIDDFMLACAENSAIVIDCYSLSCPPCLIMKPIYEKIAEEYKLKCPELKFCSVDVNEAIDIGESLDIKKIPTFFFYQGYDLMFQFSGADETQLRLKLEELVAKLQNK